MGPFEEKSMNSLIHSLFFFFFLGELNLDHDGETD
jgi:hypothetical protein